jgi:hypothetical protein
LAAERDCFWTAVDLLERYDDLDAGSPAHYRWPDRD